MTQSPESREIVIKPSQVRVGVYVRIPLPWMHHSFLTSAFLVSTDGRQMTVRYGRRGDIVGAATLFAGQLPSTVRPEPIAVSQRSMMFYISAGRSLQNSIECRNAPGELGMADAVMIPRLRWRQRSRC